MLVVVVMVLSRVLLFAEWWGVGMRRAQAFPLLLGLLEHTAVRQSTQPTQQLPINLHRQDHMRKNCVLKKNKQMNYALKPCFANLNNEILWKTNCLFSKQMLSGKHQIIKKKKNKMLWQCSCWTEGKSNVTFRRPSSFLSKAHCCLHCSQVCGGPYFFSEFVQRWHFVPMNAAMMLQYWHGFGC